MRLGIVLLATVATLLACSGVGGSEHAHDAVTTRSSDATAKAAAQVWTCPMHPQIRQPGPGKCPICGMELVPVAEGEAPGAVTVDDATRADLGIRLETVTRAPLVVEVRAPGTVKAEESGRAAVTSRVEGWVEHVYVAEPGVKVRAGQPLLAVYSPDVYAAAQELILAHGDDQLVFAARRRLELWGLTDAQISAIARGAEAPRTVDVLAPSSGYVVEKSVIEGDRVETGARLYALADLDEVWVEAAVYEAELPLVATGMPAVVTLPSAPGERFEGKVARVLPTLDAATRSGTVRVVLPNREMALRPDMYADVTLRADLGERLLVPEEAVLYTGPRRVVFVDRGNGELQPVDVQLGRRGEGKYEVLSGLSEGDRVVASGNFLVAAESRLRSTTGFWGTHDR